MGMVRYRPFHDPTKCAGDCLRDVDARRPYSPRSAHRSCGCSTTCLVLRAKKPRAQEEENDRRRDGRGRIAPDGSSSPKNSARFEPHRSGDDARRGTGRWRCYVITHDGVVVAARVLQMILDIGQCRLQGGEARGGFELRIRLGDDEQSRQCVAEWVLRARASREHGSSRLHRTPAGRDDRLECAPSRNLRGLSPPRPHWV